MRAALPPSYVCVPLLSDTQLAVAVRKPRAVLAPPVPRAPPFPDDGVRPPWRFEDSVFAPYRRPTPAFIANCFEADWDATKVPNFIKDSTERDATADVIRPHYRTIIEIFR